MRTACQWKQAVWLHTVAFSSHIVKQPRALLQTTWAAACAQGVLPEETRVTCTACAGTLLLEFGALSRLTGNPVYEARARHAHAARVWHAPTCCRLA